MGCRQKQRITERNGVWTEMGKLQTETGCGQKQRTKDRNRELRTETEMPETVVKDGNVDRVDGAKNGMERT